MKNLKTFVSVFILLALSMIGVSAQAQRQPSRNTDRQVGVILQRLDRSTIRFHNSLNLALNRVRVDQADARDDINSTEPAFVAALAQLKNQFNRRRAVAADVENVLQRASLVNAYMTRNPLNLQVQNHWIAVRNDLNALANAYGVSWQWNGQTFPTVTSNRSGRLSDSELGRLILRIDTGGDTFRSSLTDAFGESRYDQTRSEENMNNAVRGFKNATDQLRNQFDARQPVNGFVERLLARATPIDTYMRNNRLSDRAQSDWSTLRGDLNTLAAAYNLSASLGNGSSPPPVSGVNNGLTGTFRLDSSRSDSPRDLADRATRNLSNNERQDVYERLLTRLESPQMLAIERRGSTVTVASSLAARATFEADGRERQEQVGNGPSTRVTATLRGEQLVVTSNGYRENDFSVTFDATGNDRLLRVRRQIYSDRLTQPVVVDSIYDRTSDVARWGIYNGSSPVLADSPGASSGQFIVQDGETVIAVLNSDLTTNDTKQGDRFAMTVREPGQYEGAVIEGTVGAVDQGGRVTGRSGMSLNFDTIRLRDGQTYRFAGVLGSVRTLNGDTIKVDNEGSAQGDNQTTQTIQRAGIGTAIGAIIGAIAGGGKGAVIGAVVGAAGGAGSVYVQGKDNLELPSGTELTIRASAPR
jgi:hypothetical protein